MKIVKKFCHNCGIELIFSAKFCPECGTSQSSLAARPPEKEEEAPPQRLKKREPAETFTPYAKGDDDDDDDDDYVDHIKKLDISMSSLAVDILDHNRAKETFAGLIKEGASMPAGSEMGLSRPVDQTPINKDAFLKQFQQEAGTSRIK